MAAKAILITIALVTAALLLAFLVVIIAQIDVDPLSILFVSAAFITICGAGVGAAKSVAGWMARRRARS